MNDQPEGAENMQDIIRSDPILPYRILYFCREGVYSEIYRVLKPGGVFACYEWCLTDKYDASNEKHRKIKKQIEVTQLLP